MILKFSFEVSMLTSNHNRLRMSTNAVFQQPCQGGISKNGPLGFMTRWHAIPTCMEYAYKAAFRSGSLEKQPL